MIILSENNAFQNIRRCLDKKCSDVFQIEDLLQFCIQIIFYEKINIAGLIPYYIKQESEAIVNQLSSIYGIKVFNLLTIDDNGDEAKKLTDIASDELCSDIDNILRDYDKKKSINLLPKLNKYSLEIVKGGTDAINSGNPKFIYDNVDIISFAESSGFFKIICNRNNNLFEKILAFRATNKTWNNSMTLHLLSQIRYSLNKNLAILNKQIYAPSVIRGRYEKKHKIILNKIDKIFLDTNNTLGLTNMEKYVGNITMPSLMYYITEKSKGNVSDILKITAELRSKFSCVREYIKDYGEDKIVHSVGAVNEIANKVSDTLEKGASYPSRIILENTYAHTAGVGPFTFSSPVPDIQTINRLKKLGTCVIAFTEVIDDMIEYNKDNFTKRLIRNCGIS